MSQNFFIYFKKSLEKLNINKIDQLARELKAIRNKKGRVFFLGVGGSAGNASHAVNDFRKICNLQCYCPTDNISEITARTNDDGFENIFSDYLKCSNLNKNDAIFIFSVGGGNQKKKVSLNLIKAIKYAKIKKTKIFSIVGKKDGYSYKNSNISILIPSYNKKFVTPISEAMQSVIWHYLVSNKVLQINKTKW